MDEDKRTRPVGASADEAADGGEVVSTKPDGEEEADAVTGASPGTAQACSDLGLNSLEDNLSKFNIKPPGVA